MPTACDELRKITLAPALREVLNHPNRDMGQNNETARVVGHDPNTGVDTRACQSEDGRKLATLYDAQNKKLTRLQLVQHYKGLCAVICEIVGNGGDPLLLSSFAQKAISCGIPIDPRALFLPEHALAFEARKMCVLFAPCARYKRDAMEWLAHKQRKPVERIEGSIAMNFAAGGQTINPEGR